MPTFRSFIKSRPELQECDLEEQRLEYQAYIEMVLESMDDYRSY